MSEFDYVDITLVSTVVSTVRVPNNLENEDEVKDYLREYYSNSELVDEIEELTIEEIEDYSYSRDEYDEFDDRWHSGEL